MGKCSILTITTTGLVIREGITTLLLDYFSHFDLTRFELDLVVAGDYREDLISDFESIGVNIRYLPSRKKHIFRYLRALSNLMKEYYYDVFYINGSSAIMALDLKVARRCGCKVRVVHSHSTSCGHKKVDYLLRPVFYRSYTNALACSEGAGKWLFRNRPYEIIKNSRDIDTYRYNPEKREKVRKELGLKDKTYVIGHVGAFSEIKNQTFLLGVLQAIKEKEQGACLFLIGDGPLRAEVEQKAEQMGLRDSVFFTGNVKNVPDLLQAMDCMVLPSLYEGLPLVVVEWQIAALPCVLSDNVSRECAFTDWVSFCSLSDDMSVWADMILKYKDFDRNAASEKCITLAQQNGFGLKEKAERLQALFIGLANGETGS